MILSCILLRKMDSVVVSGFDAMIGLGMPCWALAKDATVRLSAPTARTMRQVPTLVDREGMSLVSISLKLRIVRKRFFGENCIRRPPASQRLHARFQLAR